MVYRDQAKAAEAAYAHEWWSMSASDLGPEDEKMLNRLKVDLIGKRINALVLLRNDAMMRIDVDDLNKTGWQLLAVTYGWSIIRLHEERNKAMRAII